MGFTIQNSLPTAQEVLEKFPLDQDTIDDIARHRQEVKDIIAGKDNRKLLIIGPCSAWPSEAVYEYAQKLQPLAEKVKGTIKVVMRVYIQKPRTTIGWLGPINQPDPLAEANITSGIYYCRELMVKVAKLGLPIADEALFTHNDSYFVDLISWIAIGARSTEDQEHRIFASMIPHPVGLKNPTSGEIKKGVNSIVAAQYEHVFGFHGNQIRTHGNPHAHLILRGGNGQPNYSTTHLQEAIGHLKESRVKNPTIIIDVSHDNSICPQKKTKDPLKQPEIISNVLQSMQSDSEIMKYTKGFMVESFLKEGKQSIKNDLTAEDLEYGKSITDGCLGWGATEKMILDLAQKLSNLS